jgi:outer membrane lipoprotein-sorting protein
MRLPQRWVPPVAAGAVVAAIAVGVPAATNSAPSLPTRSAADIISLAEQQHSISGLSGTVVLMSSLGVPAVPSTDTTGRSAEGLTGLLSGSHTLRIWAAGPDHFRVQVLGQLDETEVVRDGNQAWTYAYRTNTATRLQLPASSATHKSEAPALTAMTPQEIAQRLLAAIDPSTRVSVGAPVQVAGRSAYQLDIAPRTPKSLIGLATIAVDSRTGVPLRVTITARGARSPALTVGFTSVKFQKPSASTFAFTPPPGAKITARDLRGVAGSSKSTTPSALPIVGKGWTSVLVLPSVSLPPTLASILAKQATPIAGGTLVHTTLLNVMVADDGRILIGAVTPDVLQAAALAHG